VADRPGHAGATATTARLPQRLIARQWYWAET
jgi:hypothetical protein